MKPLIPWFDAPVLNIPLPNSTLPLHGFGLLVALGFIFGGRAAMGRATRLNLDAEVINRLVGWLVVGTFVGGHLGYGIMYRPGEYFGDLGGQFGAFWDSLMDHPFSPFNWALPELFKVWHGLSSFGGFAACVPIAIWFFWREKVSVWAFLDCLAYGMALGWFFGRMGCFVAHDHPGTETNFWLGVYGICQPGNNKMVACHDLGLYEGLWSLAMFGILTVMDRRAWKAGTLVLTLGLGYAPVRFVMDFFRPEVTDARYLGFTPAQYGAVVVVVVCIVGLVIRARSSDAPIGPARGAAASPPSGDTPTPNTSAAT